MKRNQTKSIWMMSLMMVAIFGLSACGKKQVAAPLPAPAPPPTNNQGGGGFSSGGCGNLGQIGQSLTQQPLRLILGQDNILTLTINWAQQQYGLGQPQQAIVASGNFNFPALVRTGQFQQAQPCMATTTANGQAPVPGTYSNGVARMQLTGIVNKNHFSPQGQTIQIPTLITMYLDLQFFNNTVTGTARVNVENFGSETYQVYSSGSY